MGSLARFTNRKNSELQIMDREMSFSRIKKISKQGTLFNNLLLRSKECYYCRSYDIFENQVKDIKESSLLLGS